MSDISSEGLITFLYYEDIKRAANFYADVMNFKQVVDKDWVKIFMISGNSHVGLVTGDRGWHKPSPDKPVMLTIMVRDVEAWYKYLKRKKIKTDLKAPKTGTFMKMKAFRLWDPEGYVIEIVEFMTPYGL